MRTRPTIALLAAALLAGSLIQTGSGPAGAAPTPASAAVPQLGVTSLVTGLSHPWDVAFLPNGDMFYTERPGRIGLRLSNGTVRQLTADLGDLWVSGETGLMSIEVDPAFAENRRVYTCQGTTDNSFTVQVIAWTANAGLTTLTRVNDPLVGGIDGSSGRHGGCQLKVDSAGHLRIGTGDAAVGTNPQNLNSLAGKTLRVDRFSGAGVAGNASGGDNRVYTYGHRNVQGIALRPNGEIYSVEHGTGVDDEINQLQAGANYGWDPVPGYNEARPMTDLVKFPDAIPATWSSGPTIAPSGAAFLNGPQWGDYNGALAVSILKNEELRIFGFSGNRIVSSTAPPELNGPYGRLRGAEVGPDGALYLTTANGTGDRILRVAPVGPAGGGDDVLLRYPSGGSWTWDVGRSTGSGFTAAGNWYWGRGGTREPIYVGDFNRDGRDDVLLRYQATSGWIWDIGRSTGSGFAAAGNWYWGRGGTSEPVYVGDFNADGRDDVLLRYQAAAGWIWDIGRSTGSGFAAAGNWYWGRGGTSEPVYVGDFNGDGRDDVLLRYRNASGWIWDVARSTGTGFVPLGNWYWGRGGTSEPVYVGDFNGDGRDDVLLRYQAASGWIWDVGISTGVGFAPAGNWYWGRNGTAEPVYVGDFNGDGRDDVLLRYQGTSGWIWDVGVSTGAGFASAGNWYWDRNGTAEPVYVGNFAG